MLCYYFINFVTHKSMKMKTLKRILLVIILFLATVLVNGIHYVFYGQDKSVAKLSRGEELTLYECCSVYTMHTMVWAFGWPLSPTAARECMLLHFHINADEIYSWNFKRNMKLRTPKVLNALKTVKNLPDNSSVRVAWNGNKDYALRSPEHIAAIAVNPCRVVKDTKRFNNDSICYFIESSMQYPKYSKTEFDLGIFTITVQEGLFRYLQDKNWLGKFTMIYPLGKEFD